MKRALLMMAVGVSGACALWLAEGCTIYSEPAPANAATPPVEQPPQQPVVVEAPPPVEQPRVVVQPPPPVVVQPRPSRGPGIRVVAATYGANLGLQRGNVTAALAAQCNGRPMCEYRVDFHVIGDPAPNRAKNYVAEWQCAGSPNVFRAEANAEAGFGSMIALRCDGPSYPPPPVE